MALPWIIGGIAVATVAYLATDDSSSSSSSSDREDRERELIEEAKREKNDRIIKEIMEYKENQILKISKKYNVEIDFISEPDAHTMSASLGAVTSIQAELNGTPKGKVLILKKNNLLKNKMGSLRNEVNELEKALKELKAIQNETLG